MLSLLTMETALHLPLVLQREEMRTCVLSVMSTPNSPNSSMLYSLEEKFLFMMNKMEKQINDSHMCASLLELSGDLFIISCSITNGALCLAFVLCDMCIYFLSIGQLITHISCLEGQHILSESAAGVVWSSGKSMEVGDWQTWVQHLVLTITVCVTLSS